MRVLSMRDARSFWRLECCHTSAISVSEVVTFSRL